MGMQGNWCHRKGGAPFTRDRWWLIPVRSPWYPPSWAKGIGILKHRMNAHTVDAPPTRFHSASHSFVTGRSAVALPVLEHHRKVATAEMWLSSA